jgi:glycosyltransferase involved in cell wall biosynthesis
MHVLGSAHNDVRVLREAVTLTQAGLAVTIVDVEHDRQLARQENLTGISTRHIIMPSWFTPACFKAWFLVKAGWMLFCGTVALVTTPADIYHAHDFTALPACYLAARLRRKPLIYDAHELPLVDPNVTRWRWLCAAAISVLRALVPRCAAVITVSPPIALELQRRYAGPPAVVVRNIPAYQTPVQSNRLCQHLGLDPDTRVALYQGNLQADRGLDALIRAAKFLAPSTVIIIMGHGDMQPKLEALITQEGLGHRIKIIPPVPYQQLLEWTASADLGLILNPPAYSPNVRMCLPNKLFEYMMAGLPVLSSPLEAVEDIINTYEVGRILTSLQPEEIGHFINCLLADSQVLAGMATRAAAVTKYTLCWEHESRKLLQVYHEVLNSARLESPPTPNFSPDV